jgi:hypothetical protein
MGSINWSPFGWHGPTIDIVDRLFFFSTIDSSAIKIHYEHRNEKAFCYLVDIPAFCYLVDIPASENRFWPANDGWMDGWINS